MTTGELLAKLMELYGISHAFGIPGTHTCEIYRGFAETNIRHVSPRHEQGAGFMAEGFARVLGKPAACITVSGPGALNIATAMAHARQDSLPMLVISADNNDWTLGLGQGRLHETPNLQAAMAQCSVWSHTLRRPDELPQVMARAFAIFNSMRPGPVNIIVPLNVITMNADHVPCKIWAIPSRPIAPMEQLRKAAKLLNNSIRPVMAIGGGCVDAAIMVRELAEKLDSPVTLTQHGKGIMPKGHPLYCPTSPSFASVRNMYKEADLILAIGTEFSECDYDFFFNGDFDIGDATIIRIDIDRDQLTRNVRPDLAIISDAHPAIEGLLKLTKSTDRNGAARAAAATDGARSFHEPRIQNFLDCILEALPEVVLIGDSTQPVYFAAHQYHPPAPRRFSSAAAGYGTLGLALPAAFGAKLARPDLPVIGLIGDGGLQFTINELAAGVEAQLPVIVLVWNNNGYKMIDLEFRRLGMEPQACDIYTPDFKKIADGYGCPYFLVRTLDDLKLNLREAQFRSVPTVIEVIESDFI